MLIMENNMKNLKTELQRAYDSFVSGKYNKFVFYPQDIQDAKRIEMQAMFESTVDDIPKRKLLRKDIDAKYIDPEIESKIVPFVEVDGVKLFVDDILPYIETLPEEVEPPMPLHIVRGLRAAEYAKLNQYEMMYNDKINGTNTWGEAIEAIKLKFPKPSLKKLL
jgi:hypothetical protein